MTDTAEQASAQTEEQKTQTAAEMELAEEKRRKDQEQEKNAAIRNEWRSIFLNDDAYKSASPDMMNTFIQMWSKAPVGSAEFVAGISNIADFKQDEKEQGNFTLVSKANNEFSYIVRENAEFIGLTKEQAAAKKMTADTADDIVLTAFARGWKEINVHGNSEEKDMLWVAAQKYGLAVNNYIPSEAARQAYEEMKAAGSKAENTGVTPLQGVTKFAGTAPESKDDIPYADFKEIKPAALAGSKIAGLLPPPPSNGGNDKGPPALPPPGR